jgi:hypothetical protein
VNALANPNVGKYLEQYFIAAFQRVGTFRIVGQKKQGGNVATYFCAADGRVLHAIAGPVDAQTMLVESKWVVKMAQKGIEESKGDGAAFKSFLRKAHADKLRIEHGLVVQPVTYDPPTAFANEGALTYRDSTGQPLSPKLPPAPIDGPDVKLRGLQENAAKALGAKAVMDRRGGRWVLGNQGRVHVLLAAHCLLPIEQIYGSVFEGILGERISTRPVEVVDPFPGRGRLKVEG